MLATKLPNYSYLLHMNKKKRNRTNLPNVRITSYHEIEQDVYTLFSLTLYNTRFSVHPMLPEHRYFLATRFHRTRFALPFKYDLFPSSFFFGHIANEIAINQLELFVAFQLRYARNSKIHLTVSCSNVAIPYRSSGRTSDSICFQCDERDRAKKKNYVKL